MNIFDIRHRRTVNLQFNYLQFTIYVQFSNLTIYRPLPNPSGLRRLRSPIAPLLTGNCPEGRLPAAKTLPLGGDGEGSWERLFNLQFDDLQFTIYLRFSNLTIYMAAERSNFDFSLFTLHFSLRRRRYFAGLALFLLGHL